MQHVEPDAVSEPDDADFDRMSEHNTDDDDDAAEEAKLEETEHFDQLACIGFAIAQSVASMEGFTECLDSAWMKPVKGLCSHAERAELNHSMEMLFTRRPLLQSTPPKEDPNQARILKPLLK